jgi:hypothetical protein
LSPPLAPPPRRLRRTGEAVSLAAVRLQAAGGDPACRPAVERLAEGLGELGVTVRGGARPASAPGAAETAVAEIPVRLRHEAGAAGAGGSDEGYRLEVASGGIEIAAPAAAGLAYGAETLLQWLAPATAGAPLVAAGVRIEDHPGFRHRGLMLDISRNRVPTQEALYDLVDLMARLKLNQLQLYTEHTFAYRGHEIVWRDASPLTADEVRELDAHCRRRFIELVPNQNSFGHLHRWLKHPAYGALAEVPGGMPHPFFDHSEPFSLCPLDPGALDLLRDLYGQLLPNFTSRRFNVGCDETFDIGKGRSADACRERGTGQVYLDFLLKLHALAAAHGRTIQFWGDILASYPELLDQVPPDAAILEWGYEAGHPFAKRLAPLAAAGLEIYLCPGTSSWNSFAGRLDNAVANLAEAARAGVEHGASGYLITDWGDFGHLQPPPVSWPPLIAGAAFAWNPDAAEDPSSLPLPGLVDRLAGKGLAAGTGEVLTLLGNVYKEAGVTPMNASALSKLVIFAHRSLEGAGLDKLTVEGLDRAETAVDIAADRLASLGEPPRVVGTLNRSPNGSHAPETGGTSRSSGGTSRSSHDLVRRELDWAAGMLRFACRLGRSRLSHGGEESVTALPAAKRRALARELGRRVEELTPLWLERCRPGGLADSQGRLEAVRRLLSGGTRLPPD